MDYPVSASGEPACPILVIGEAPGELELKRGSPFVGPSGRILWTAFKRFGIDRSICFVTNVVQSAPQAKSGKPSHAQIMAEWERLDAEMAASQARIVVLVGGVPLKRVTGLRRGIQYMRGYLLKPEHCTPVLKRVTVQEGEYQTSRKCQGCKGAMGTEGVACHECNGTGYQYRKGDPKFKQRRVAVPPTLPPNTEWIIPILHPAGIMRSQFKPLPAFRADIERIARAVRGDLEVIDRVPFSTEAAEVGSEVVIDIEGMGCIDRIGAATSLGVSRIPNSRHIDGSDTWTAPWSADTAGRVRSWFTEGRVFVCHNAGFDIPQLADACGVSDRLPEVKVFDTMLAAQVLHPDLPKGLEKVGSLYLDITPWKHTSEGDPEHYNAKDVVAENKCKVAMVAALEETGQTKMFDTIMKALPNLWLAEKLGCRIDMEYLARWQAGLVHELKEIIQKWPYPEYDPGSSRQMAKLLYHDLKLPQQHGKSGGETTDAAAIKFLLHEQDEHIDLLQLLLDYRTTSYDLNSWGSLKTEAGRVHARFLPGDKEEEGEKRGQGAATGRIQPRDPNLANPDREARKLIIPDPGYVFAYSDWAQAEVRVEATASKDEALWAAMEAGLHDWIGERIGVDRTRAKNAFYGTRNGAGPRKLVKVMRAKGFFDVTEHQMAELQQEFFRLFPKWANWRMWLIETARQLGYGANPFGRRRYFYHRSAAPEIIGNFPQATVADMLWRVLSQLKPYILITPVHDALLYQAPEGEIKATVTHVEELMSQEFPEIEAGWRCPVETKIGLPRESWGAMEERYAA